MCEYIGSFIKTIAHNCCKEDDECTASSSSSGNGECNNATAISTLPVVVKQNTLSSPLVQASASNFCDRFSSSSSVAWFEVDAASLNYTCLKASLQMDNYAYGVLGVLSGFSCTEILQCVAQDDNSPATVIWSTNPKLRFFIAVADPSVSYGSINPFTLTVEVRIHLGKIYHADSCCSLCCVVRP
jgi:hypothetical protein